MTENLSKDEWRPFLDQVSKALPGQQAEVEVASLRLGSQVAASSLPLLGLTYDPEDDIVEIALEGLDHLIEKPKEIHVTEETGQFLSLEIVAGDGTRHIVKLKHPVMLPAH